MKSPTMTVSIPFLSAGCLLCYTRYGIVLNVVRRPFKSTGVIPVLRFPGYRERCEITDLTLKFAG